jgi:hypothetical protein
MMTRVKELIRGQDARDLGSSLGILSQSGCGSWVICLPPDLRAYQGELEALLGRVFAGNGQLLSDNFDLAQQMSLNWCMSKCRQVGISFEESLSKLPAMGEGVLADQQV